MLTGDLTLFEVHLTRIVATIDGHHNTIILAHEIHVHGGLVVMLLILNLYGLAIILPISSLMLHAIRVLTVALS
jgi:hypothetical protein